MADEHEAHALDFLDRIAAMTDDELRRTYLACEGECGEAWQEALGLACAERNIDL